VSAGQAGSVPGEARVKQGGLRLGRGWDGGMGKAPSQRQHGVSMESTAGSGRCKQGALCGVPACHMQCMQCLTRGSIEAEATKSGCGGVNVPIRTALIGTCAAHHLVHAGANNIEWNGLRLIADCCHILLGVLWVTAVKTTTAPQPYLLGWVLQGVHHVTTSGLARADGSMPPIVLSHSRWDPLRIKVDRAVTIPALSSPASARHLFRRCLITSCCFL
jgi:hypothetical protein